VANSLSSLCDLGGLGCGCNIGRRVPKGIVVAVVGTAAVAAGIAVIAGTAVAAGAAVPVHTATLPAGRREDRPGRRWGPVRR